MAKTVKSEIEFLNKLIDHFEDRARWAEGTGNISVAEYNYALAETLRLIRNGVLNKLIDHFEDHARWAEGTGNIFVAEYNYALAETLRRVRNGDFS